MSFLNRNLLQMFKLGDYGLCFSCWIFAFKKVMVLLHIWGYALFYLSLKAIRFLWSWLKHLWVSLRNIRVNCISWEAKLANTTISCQCDLYRPFRMMSFLFLKCAFFLGFPPLLNCHEVNCGFPLCHYSSVDQNGCMANPPTGTKLSHSLSISI